MFKTRFYNFFGIVVEVQVDESDIRHLDFFYNQFETDSTNAKYHVTLESLEWPTRGFFASLLAKDGLLKRVLVQEQYGPDFQNEFRDWSNLPSPLPPLQGRYFKERLLIYPGSVLKMPNGSVYGFFGENYVGKTSLAIALTKLGAELVSDSLIVIDSLSGSTLKYETPLGFRRKGLIDIIPKTDICDYRVTISPDTGLVLLMKPIDVLGKHNVEGGLMNHLIFLKKAPADVPFLRRKIRTPNIPWFGSGKPNMIPEYSEMIEFSLAPDALAEMIYANYLGEIDA